MTTTTMTSRVTRRFDDERRLVDVESPLSAANVRFDFLLHAEPAAAVRRVVPAPAAAAAAAEGALRVLSRRSIKP